MVCLRCGYCCKHLSVLVVKNPKKGLNQRNTIWHEGLGEPCIHLKGEKVGEYYCAVHNYKWYKKTPCFAHTQIEASPKNPCRMGVYMLERMEKN